MGLFVDLRHLGCTVALFGGLAACVETGVSPDDASKTAAAPVATRAEMLSAHKAMFIVTQCNEQFDFGGQAGPVLLALAQQFEAEGPEKTAAKATPIVTQKEAQDDMFRYISARNIVLANKETVCAAGAAEMVGKTAIGKYLVRK